MASRSLNQYKNFIFLASNADIERFFLNLIVLSKFAFSVVSLRLVIGVDIEQF